MGGPMTETVTIRNGIDVDQLQATIAHVQDDAAAATFTFRASSQWQDGMFNIGRIGAFDHAGERLRPAGAEGLVGQGAAKRQPSRSVLHARTQQLRETMRSSDLELVASTWHIHV